MTTSHKCAAILPQLLKTTYIPGESDTRWFTAAALGGEGVPGVVSRGLCIVKISSLMNRVQYHNSTWKMLTIARGVPSFSMLHT